MSMSAIEYISRVTVIPLLPSPHIHHAVIHAPYLVPPSVPYPFRSFITVSIKLTTSEHTNPSRNTAARHDLLC